MTWPTASVSTGNFDAGTDNPSLSRADLLDLILKANQMMANGEPVVLTGPQTVGGVKTFTSAPKISVAASASDEPIRKGELDALIASIVGTVAPTGMVAFFSSSYVPINWLACAGQEVSRTTYASLWLHAQLNGNMAADLADKIANPGKFFTGNGSTTFTLPDLRGDFIRALDAGRNIDIGRGTGTFQDQQYPSHTHTLATFGDETGGGGIATGSGIVGPTVTTSASGSGSNVLVRNTAYLLCMFTGRY